MSYEPADHNRALRRFLSVLIIASSVASCTGGAGLDVPIRPVDHSCANGSPDRVPGGDSSGCS